MRLDSFQLVVETRERLGLTANARTKSGVIFDATGDRWSYRDGIVKVALNYLLLKRVSPVLMNSIKRVMLVLAETGAPSSLSAYFSSLKRFLEKAAEQRQSDLTQLTGVDFLNFTAEGNPREAGHIRTLLQKWHALGAPGLAHDVLPTLRTVRVKAPPKGVAVATMDPKLGPFTEIEFQALQSALSDAYVSGALRPSAYAMTWLFIATGARPMQLAAMKVKDVHGPSVEGATDYSIDVPSVKKSTTIRGCIKNRPLVKSIGAMLVQYAAAVQKAMEGRLENLSEAPLFPATFSRKPWAPGFEYHRDSQSIGEEVRVALSGLKVISERTGKPMRVNPVRLRRTFGTRAAQEGHGVLVIAELLDHADTQNAGVYVESRPDLGIRIDKATAFDLAPIAQAFSGKLIRSESEATRAGDKASRIRDLRVAIEPLASCGQHSFCGMSAPIACYTCENFEPWLDGPHEEMLNYLLARRARQFSDIDTRIATVLDRTILAVAYVVQLCSLPPAELDALLSVKDDSVRNLRGGSVDEA